jgi:hypothetical protein
MTVKSCVVAFILVKLLYLPAGVLHTLGRGSHSMLHYSTGAG